MKKILLGILVFICFINVNAKDYELKELIPIDEKVSVTTQSFFYHDFSFNGKNSNIKFDSIKGLYNAIYYDEKQLLSKFKERFKECKLFISPDYSECGDVHVVENIYRIFKARIVSIWLTMECNAIVVPNITYSNREMFEIMLLGLEDVETVAFGTKGNLNSKEERLLLIDAIKYTVDHLSKLKTIIVYSSCKRDETIQEVFKYASDNNIKIIIPSNTLQIRNKEGRNGKI